MANIWLTSDTHLFHDKNFVWKARGFDNVEQMVEAIEERWNAVVKEDDIVYHLGDVTLGSRLEESINILKRLNGTKYLAFGNHDTDTRISAFRTEGVFADIQMGYRIKKSKYMFIATHYPTIVANENDKSKIFNLCGHSHTSNPLIDYDKYKIYHVEMDAHNCYPINLDDIIKQLKQI